MAGCSFSFSHYKALLRLALDRGYGVHTCARFCADAVKEPFLVLRHDVEFNPGKALEFARIEHSLGVKSSFFFRVHAKEYNLFNYKVYTILRQIMDYGHEIGLHAENLDLAHITGEDPREVIRKEKAFLELLLGREVVGVSSHGDFSGISNMAFWKDNSPGDFGFKYQAYEDRFFKHCAYVSDSLRKWKRFEDGRLVEENGRCLCRHIAEGIPRLYTLIHPRMWYHQAYFLED